MHIEAGKYGFVTIRDGAYKNELGFYMEDVEPDADGYCRAHVALVEKSRVVITKPSNLEWAPNQEELAQKYDPSPEEEPCPILARFPEG